MKVIHLIFQPKHYGVGTQKKNGSFEQTKHMLNLMDKNIFIILRSDYSEIVCLFWPMGVDTWLRSWPSLNQCV